MAEIILSKESSESKIKRYFNAVLELSKSDNEFPINFDEVWMLVYEDKRSAIHELKDKFIKDVDYQTVRKKVQASNVAGFVWADEYHLTVSCMEFFIARKVRPVFEIYRKVFHKVANNAVALPSYQIDDRIERAKRWIEEEEVRQQLALENEQQQETISSQATELSIAEKQTAEYRNYINTLCTHTTTQIAREIGMRAAEINQKLNQIGVITKNGRGWQLTPRYDFFGYATTRPFTTTGSNGETINGTFLVWTPKGRSFILALHECDWDIKQSNDKMPTVFWNY